MLHIISLLVKSRYCTLQWQRGSEVTHPQVLWEKSEARSCAQGVGTDSLFICQFGSQQNAGCSQAERRDGQGEGLGQIAV